MIAVDRGAFNEWLQTGGSGGEDRLTENVTLNFAKVKVKNAAHGLAT